MKISLFASFSLSGLALVASIVVAFILFVQFIDVISEYVEMWRLKRRGRCIQWDKAIDHCRAQEAFLVIESRRVPRKVWCVMGTSPSVLTPVGTIRKERGLIVINPPPIDDSLMKRHDIQGRVIEIHFNEILSRAS